MILLRKDTHDTEKMSHFNILDTMYHSGLFIVFMVLTFSVQGCSSSEDAPVQAPERPLDYDIVNPVQEASSDRASKVFQDETLPTMIKMGSESFNTEAIAEKFTEVALDPTQLKVVETTRIRVYFVGEYSGKENSLGVRIDPSSGESGTPQLIFPRASSSKTLYETANVLEKQKAGEAIINLGERSEATPLVPGDFVDLGSIKAGSTLNFFLIDEGARGGANVYWPNPDDNADGIQHMVAIAMEDSPYMLLSFEDLLGGGDRDFSDCVFAVSLSHYNMQALLGDIDPLRRAKQIGAISIVLLIVIGGPIGVQVYLRKRRKKINRQQLDKVNALMQQGNFSEAVTIIQKRKQQGFDEAPTTQHWYDLELNAYEGLHDIEALSTLFDGNPEDFAAHETASLWVAQAALETEQHETAKNFSEFWQKNNPGSGVWKCFEVDELVSQDKSQKALDLLNSTKLKKEYEAGRLSRIAWLNSTLPPDQSHSLIQKALSIAPQHSDVHIHAGYALERLGELKNAAEHIDKALRLDPQDVFIRNKVGEFYRRNGKFKRALTIWKKGLTPPSTGFIWLKTLFWQRVSVPIPLDVSVIPLPEGYQNPLLELIIQLPEDTFWDEAAFDLILKKSPDLLRCQEVFWLRLLEFIRLERYENALSLLKLARFENQAWHIPLEKALLQLLTFRLYSFLDPENIRQTDVSPKQNRPCFTVLHHWSLGKEPDAAFMNLMQSHHIFSAVFFAAGWHEAGLRLQQSQLPSVEIPLWYIQDIHSALKSNRSGEEAANFAHRYNLNSD